MFLTKLIQLTIKSKGLFTQKNKDQGFTLLELLVTIIIVGTLAAIGLPSYLNQAGKARGSEAKSVLGTINRSQQGYRLEQGIFADNLDKLDVGNIPNKYYDYAITGTSTALFAEHTATAKTGNTDIKNFSSGVSQASSSVFTQIICESNDVAGDGGSATVISASFTCDSNSTRIE